MTNIAKYINMSEKEELMVWRKFKDLGSVQDKNILIEKYAPLVKYVAGKVINNVPRNIEFDDLVGFGVFGLLDAINKFDPEKGIKFKTYGITRIRGQIFDELRNLDWVPRSVRQKFKQMEEIKKKYKEEKGEIIKKEQLAEKIGISISEVERINNMANDSNIASLDDVWLVKKNDDEVSFIDLLKSNDDNNPVNDLEREEVKKMIVGELKKLPEREQRVLILYYYEELTLKEIGEVLTLTESRVSQLHTKAIRKIRDSLDSIKKSLV